MNILFHLVINSEAELSLPDNLLDLLLITGCFPVLSSYIVQVIIIIIIHA